MPEMIATSEDILLVDHADPLVRYSVSLSGGRTTQTRYRSSDEAASGARGYAQYRRLWISGRRTKALVGFFTKGERIWLLMGTVLLDLSGSGSKVRRTTIIPFVRRFDVHRDHERVLRVKYLSPIFEDDSKDLFTYVHETLKSEESQQRFIYTWQAIAEGRDIMKADFHHELEIFLKTSRR
jgi:hypothetical protein